MRTRLRPPTEDLVLAAIRRQGPAGISRTWLVSDCGPKPLLDPILDRLVGSGLVEVRVTPARHGPTWRRESRTYFAREATP